MAIIPPWLSTSPRDFVAAAQAGASAGAQAAQIRQRGQLEAARLAQAAAMANAARQDAAAARGESLDFRRWEREQMMRQAQAQLAQQAQQNAVTLALRGRELASKDALAAAGLAMREELGAGNLQLGQERLKAQQAHWKEMEKAAADKVKAQFNLPAKTRIYSYGGTVVGIDEKTGESKILFTFPKTTTR